MKIPRPHRRVNRQFTAWIRPYMTGYKMGCCDCGLFHTINFRALKVVKVHKNGSKTGVVLPKDKYVVEMKVARNEKWTRLARKK